MFTLFAFSEDEKMKFQDVVRHLGPQMEDLVNIAIYDFPERYRQDIFNHMKEPGYKTALQKFILEAYHELKGTENLVDKWEIYHGAIKKIKKYFVHTLKTDTSLNPWKGGGNDVY